jgi:hypothetical protein
LVDENPNGMLAWNLVLVLLTNRKLIATASPTFPALLMPDYFSLMR